MKYQLIKNTIVAVIINGDLNIICVFRTRAVHYIISFKIMVKLRSTLHYRKNDKNTCRLETIIQTLSVSGYSCITHLRYTIIEIKISLS